MPMYGGHPAEMVTTRAGATVHDIAVLKDGILTRGVLLDISIHQVGNVTIGLGLIDAANVDDLVVQCEALGRWDFMFTVAPLRFPGGTGLPVRPLATF